MVLQIEAIIYCTQQVIQGGKLSQLVENCKNSKISHLEPFATYGMSCNYVHDTNTKQRLVVPSNYIAM